MIHDKVQATILNHIPTKTEEPNGDIRWQIAQRILVERLPDHIPTEAEEPNDEIRRWIRNRLQERTAR